MNSSPTASVAVLSPTPAQANLFDLSDLDGFGALSRREQRFAEAIVSGMSQRQAAKFAGISGDQSCLDSAGYDLARKAQVRRVVTQALNRAGASIDTTLAQAVRVQLRALDDWEKATDLKARQAAHREWLAAATLIASIHGRLNINVTGGLNHEQSFTVPAAALEAMAQMRREVVAQRISVAAEPVSGS
jgi:hypothetical protein